MPVWSQFLGGHLIGFGTRVAQIVPSLDAAHLLRRLCLEERQVDIERGDSHLVSIGTKCYCEPYHIRGSIEKFPD